MPVLQLPAFDALAAGQPPPLILDVRLPEDFAEAHLPGAAGACVYEVTFPQRVAELAPDKTRPVVVYGAAQTSLESGEAAAKLARLGYAAVHDFRGGLAAWRAAGRPVEGGAARQISPPLEGERPVDLRESRVEWTGRNLLNRHAGTVPLTSGKLVFQNGWLSGGDFALDLAGLTCTDIADPALNRGLLEHLHGDDFFDVARFPVAWFVIRQTEPVPGGTPGAPNLRVTGDFTLKAVTRPLAFPAVAGRTPDGRAAMQAVLAFDRTRWDVRYGSGKLFHRLGKHLVNDLVEIQVRLVA